MFPDQGKADWSIADGMPVYASDGEKLGTLRDYDPQAMYLDVHKGWLFPRDLFVPAKTIAHVDDDGIVLTIAKTDLIYPQDDETSSALSDFKESSAMRQDGGPAADWGQKTNTPGELHDPLLREGSVVDLPEPRDRDMSEQRAAENARDARDRDFKQ